MASGRADNACGGPGEANCRAEVTARGDDSGAPREETVDHGVQTVTYYLKTGGHQGVGTDLDAIA